MPNRAGRLKCSECVRRGRPCVSLSWASLDKTQEELQKKIDEDERVLAEVLARLMRNKTILRQARERARQKTLCLMDEMTSTGELAEVEPDCPGASALVGLSPAVWQTLSSLDDLLPVVDDTPLVPVGNFAG